MPIVRGRQTVVERKRENDGKYEREAKCTQGCSLVVIEVVESYEISGSNSAETEILGDSSHLS